jgi:hypothetical protein
MPWENYMKNLTLAALAAAITLTATTAFAADKPSPTSAPNDYFQKMDANHDSLVSKDEWRARGDKMFEDIDNNHDGKISADEMKAHHDARKAEWLAKHPRMGTKAAEKMQDAPAAK